MFYCQAAGANKYHHTYIGGVAINALAFAVIGLLSFFADDSALRLINYWTMGLLGGSKLEKPLFKLHRYCLLALLACGD
ncbi:hypothetical protein ACOBV9_22155 (plasmid) [Pseudoalteromonas espejiana]